MSNEKWLDVMIILIIISMGIVASIMVICAGL